MISLVSAPTNAERVSKVVPRARLQVLPGVGHYTFLAECLPAGVSARPDLCHEEPGVDRAQVHRAVSADAVAFFGQALAVH